MLPVRRSACTAISPMPAGCIAEDGALTLSEGTRPAHEAVTVREIISKVDLNRDGVLAAASARKLDKGAYSLQDRTLERASRARTGVLSIREALADLLVAEPRVLQPRASPESGAVESWFRQYFLGGVADVLEVAWGYAVVSDAARRHGYRVVPAFVQGKQAYGITWNLAAEGHLEAISGAVLRAEPKVLVIGLEGKNVPRAFLQLVVRCAQERTRAGAHVALHLQAQKGEWEPWRLEEWGALFGTLAEPRWPWAFVRADICQFARASGRDNLVESGALWLADFSLESVGLRCSRPDALGAVQHKHVGRAQADYNLIGAAFCASLQDLGLRGAEELCTAAVESFPATAGADSAAAAPQPSPVIPLPDVRSGEDLTPAERAELDKEVDMYAAEKEAYWRTKADAKDWDSVRADLEVYALAGEKVAEDPRRTEAYRDLVWSGLKIEPGPTRPGLTDADIAAVREVIRRKAAGFWVEDTTRTTVRKFAHDCIPTGPPVSSQPHSLRGESAQWVDDKLEEECKRGQLIRGSSAWGSAPFPTKEMPSYKRHRKRRLVVDYRRVNARIKRSTYYCRRGSDVLAAAVGSVWYTFVDAVSGFNQIRNTKRAREVLAIVARSGKYLPVGLTFGPINGPDDFNFVVDRAYAPGRGRRLKYTKEWIAYVDDLTVRTGRVIDGQFFTDAQAEGAVREACAKGAVAAPQSASSALEALGVRGAHNTKRANHDAARSDQNHPTRVLMLRMLGLFGCFCVQGGCFWGGPFPRSPVCGQKDFSSFVACSFVPLSRSQCFASRPRGSVQGRSRSLRSLRAQTLRKLPKPPPQRFKCVVEPRVGSPSPRSCLCTAPRCGSRPDRAGATDRSPGPSWSTTRPRCGPCPGRAGAAADHDCTPAPCSGPCPGRSRARQVFLAHRRSSKAAGLSAAMGGGGSKGRGKSKSPGPKGRKGPPTIDDVQRMLVRCMRHGEAGCRGRFAPGGLCPVDELIEQLGITINQYNQAVAHDANQRKPRLDTSYAGYLRAFQGHSADCGHPMGFMMEGLSETAINDLIYRHGPAMWHGTDLHVVPSLIENGLVPGGGPGGRLGVHYVLGHCPTQWEDGRRGFRRGSTCIVEVRLAVLRDAGVPIYAGADGVALTGQIRATGISRIWALPKGSAVYSILIAELEVDRLIQHVDLRSLGDISAGPHPPLGRGPKLGKRPKLLRPAVARRAPRRLCWPLRAVSWPRGPPNLLPLLRPRLRPKGVLQGLLRLRSFQRSPRSILGATSLAPMPSRPKTRSRKRQPGSSRHAGAPSRGQGEGGRRARWWGPGREHRGRSPRTWPIGGQHREGVPRAVRSSSETRILEVAGTAMVKLEKITKREESLKTLRRGGENRAAGEGADGEEVSDDGQDAPKGSSSSARPSRGKTVRSAPAPEVPRPNADGHYGCSAPGCGLAFESLVQYHLHQAACHGASLPPNLGISPSAPLDPFRQDWRGRLFRRGKDGGYGEVPMLRVIRYHKANGYDHSKVPLLKRGDRIQLEDGSHHIYGGSHPPGWLRDDPELDPAPESSGGGSTPKSEPTEEAEHGPPREAAPRGRALGPPTSDVQQRLAERRRSKRDYSPDLVTPLDDLHAQEIDSFFAGDPAVDSLDVILMRAEVRTESHLNVGREQEEPLVKEEHEEEAEVVKDEEVWLRWRQAPRMRRTMSPSQPTGPTSKAAFTPTAAGGASSAKPSTRLPRTSASPRTRAARKRAPRATADGSTGSTSGGGR